MVNSGGSMIVSDYTDISEFYTKLTNISVIRDNHAAPRQQASLVLIKHEEQWC